MDKQRSGTSRAPVPVFAIKRPRMALLADPNYCGEDFTSAASNASTPSVVNRGSNQLAAINTSCDSLLQPQHYHDPGSSSQVSISVGYRSQSLKLSTEQAKNWQPALHSGSMKQSVLPYQQQSLYQGRSAKQQQQQPSASCADRSHLRLLSYTQSKPSFGGSVGNVIRPVTGSGVVKQRQQLSWQAHATGSNNSPMAAASHDSPIATTNADWRRRPVTARLNVDCYTGDNDNKQSVGTKVQRYYPNREKASKSNSATAVTTGQTQLGLKQPAYKMELKSADLTMRFVTTTIDGMKRWTVHKDKLVVMFEVFGVLNSAVTCSDLTSTALTFILKDDSDSVNCTFYQIDRQLARMTRGLWYRCVGHYYPSSDVGFKCISIRPATETEKGRRMVLVEKGDRALEQWIYRCNEC